MFDIYFIYYLEGQGRWFKSIAESEPEETYLKVMDILSILINNVVGWWPKRAFNQSNTVGPTPGVEKNILLSGTAREHWKIFANIKVNRHSDTVTVWH
jgi:hypothetical protein